MIWLVGSKGMLGKEIASLFNSEGISFLQTDFEIDITSKKDVSSFCFTYEPDWIINCAAYTNVDLAEDEKRKAYYLNTVGPKNLSFYANKIGAKLIHFSTDYVFGDIGLKRPLKEDDETRPESVYGKTKLDGELEIRKELEMHFIIRLSWLYGFYGPNFVNTILDLLKINNKISVVNDQYGTPTWTKDVARIVKYIIESNKHKFGIYHYSGEGITNWFGFAEEIKKQSNEIGLISSTTEIVSCSTNEFGQKAKRPSWSVISKEKIKESMAIIVPQWQDSLRKYLSEMR